MDNPKNKRMIRSKSIIDTSQRLILQSEMRNFDEIFYCEGDGDDEIDVSSYLDSLKKSLNKELGEIIEKDILDKMFQNFDAFSRHDVWTHNKAVDRRKMIVYLFDFTEKDKRVKFYKHIKKKYRELIDTDYDQPISSPNTSPRSMPNLSYLKKRSSLLSSFKKKKFKLPETLLPDFKWELDHEDVTIEKELSEGSYGTVFLGTFQNKKVAIKKLPSKVGDERSRNILNEISLLCRLDHNNIVKFIGATLGEEISLITQYEKKGDLRSLLDQKREKNKRFSQRRILQMATDITKGLEFLHSNGIIHGDMKSSNTLVSSTFECKLTDFGLSFKSRASRNTQSYGTLPYLAPELIRDIGGIPSVESDVYSLGMIFYELAEYRPPFDGYDVIKLLNFKEQNEMPKITQPTSNDFKTLIYSCLNEEPRSRPTTNEILNILNLMKSS